MNAAEPQQVAELDSKAKRASKVADDDLSAIMSEQTGRRFIYRVFEMAGIFRLSYTGNSETFFNEGARNIGLRLLAEIQRVCPDSFILMLKEHSKNQ